VTDASLVLAGIPGFATALVRARLSNGPSNASYLIEQGDAAFVLRVDKPEATRLGLDREAEGEVLRALASAGLVEAPLYSAPSQGILLRRFIPGRTWSPDEWRESGKLARLAHVLRKLHALSPAGRPFDPLGAARRYAMQLGTPRAQAVLEAAAKAYAAIPPATPVLCHNDPVCGNILESGDRLILIDWEYAGGGDPFFDLAVVVEHHAVDEQHARGFVAAYLGREPGDDDLGRLDRHCRFYGRLLELWRLRVGETA